MASQLVMAEASVAPLTQKKDKNREESAFYKDIANSHKELYKERDELEQHFTFEVLKVFKFRLDCEVDEGVRMVMHKGLLVNNKKKVVLTLNSKNNNRKRRSGNGL